MPASTMPAASAIAPTTRSCRERKRSGCSTGSDARFSTIQNAAAARIATTRTGQIRVEPRLAGKFGASTWFKLQTAPASASARRGRTKRVEGARAGGRSGRQAAEARDDQHGRDGHVDEEQPTPAPAQQQPPSNGPSRNASPNTAPMRPSVRPRFSSGTVSAMTALATGKIPPAPNAWIARPTSSTSNVGAAATSNDPAAKRPRLCANTPRRPIRSESFAEQRRADDVEQHVDAEHPGQRSAADAVRIADRWQGRTHDRDVERRDEHAGEQQRENGPWRAGSHQCARTKRPRTASRNIDSAAGWPS